MLKLETAYFNGDKILRFEKINFLDVIIVGIKPAALCFIVHLHYIDLHFSSCGNSAICSEKKRPLSLYNPIYDVTRQALGQLICRHWDYSWCLINLIAVVCVCVFGWHQWDAAHRKQCGKHVLPLCATGFCNSRRTCQFIRHPQSCFTYVVPSVNNTP